MLSLKIILLIKTLPHLPGDNELNDPCSYQLTHNLSLSSGATAIRGGQRGGAGLAVPGYVAILCSATNGHGVYAVGVAIAVTTVVVPTSVTGGPYEYWAFASTALKIHKETRS